MSKSDSFTLDTESLQTLRAALEQLPATSEALRAGQLRWSAVRELSRVATVETERAWVSAAEGATARQVEKLVRASERYGFETVTTAMKELQAYTERIVRKSIERS